MQRCRFFGTTQGCWEGDACRFVHDLSSVREASEEQRQRLVARAFGLRRHGHYLEALKAFQAALDLGSPVAAFELGKAFRDNVLTLWSDSSMAAALLRAAGAYPPAQACLSDLLSDRPSLEQHEDENEDLAHAALASGDLYSMGVVRINRDADPDLGMEHLSAAAAAGNPHAMEMLGCVYQRHRNYLMALHWLQQAAGYGLGLAQYRVGYIHYKGKVDGVPDLTKALPWLDDAAKNGYSAARRRTVRTRFRRTLPHLCNWGRAAHDLMLSTVLSNKDLACLGERLALTPDDIVGHEADRLRELYWYGYKMSFSQVVTGFPDEEGQCLRVYRASMTAALRATVALLGINRRRRGTTLSWLPRDVAVLLGKGVWQLRADPVTWGVRLTVADESSDEDAAESGQPSNTKRARTE